jgi:hypothetical protein
MPLAAGLALAVSFVLTGAPAQASSPASIMPAAQSPQTYVADYFSDIPVMIDIASCESHFKQYDSDGSVYRGAVNHGDVGIMQVNEYYHAAAAEKLGLDLYTIEGNVAYARYLYQKEGTQPWVSSKPCWGPMAARDGSLAKTKTKLVATIQK